MQAPLHAPACSVADAAPGLPGVAAGPGLERSVAAPWPPVPWWRRCRPTPVACCASGRGVSARAVAEAWPARRQHAA